MDVPQDSQVPVKTGNKLVGNADPKSRYSTITNRTTGTTIVLTYTVTSIRTSIKSK